MVTMPWVSSHIVRVSAERAQRERDHRTVATCILSSVQNRDAVIQRSNSNGEEVYLTSKNGSFVNLIYLQTTPY